MSVSSSRLSRSPAAKLAAYGVILAAALGGGAAVGAALGPEPSTPGHPTHEATSSGPIVNGYPLPAGLVVAQNGYQLHLDTRIVAADTEAELSFVITGPDGAPVTTFDVAHEKELHLVLVSRDLTTYAHLHPHRDAAGTWTVTVPPLPAGSYRAYADFVPTGSTAMTLAADLSVPGDYAPRTAPAPSTTTSVDGYDITFDGVLVAGTESELTVTVTRDGAPVTDLQPYLGALGHLVAIRDGDLAYLHVHPLDATDGPGGPTVRFAVDVPTAGTYGLYFDFSHGDVMRTATVVTVAAPSERASATVTSDDGGHGG